MPDNSKQNQAQEAESNYGLPSNWKPIDSAPLNPNQPAGGPPAPSGVNPYGSGPLPPNFGYAPALVKTGQTSSTGPIDLMPIQGGAGDNAKAIGVAKTVVDEAIAGISSGVTLIAGNRLKIVGNVISTTDPIIDGDVLWEIDPAAFIQKDDFASGSLTSGSIGELGWTTGTIGSGGAANTPYYYGGGPIPIFGEIRLPNNGTADAGIVITPNLNGISSSIFQDLWALLDHPNWKYILEFRFVFSPEGTGGRNGGAVFSMAQKSFYGGLYCTNGTLNTIRPPVFLGVRYDTDTTAPSIADTTLKFEAVANPLSGTRNNIQGQVFDTGMIPNEQQQFRLEILCTSVGIVTLSLSNGLTTSSTTFTIPQLVISTTGGATQGNADQARITYPAGIGQVPWGPGSNVTFSAFTGAETILNGVQSVIFNSNGGQLNFLSAYNSVNNDTPFTGTGYPAYNPVVIFGNSTAAGPVGNGAASIDLYGFVWNPGVGGGSGTPNSVLPRYFA